MYVYDCVYVVGGVYNRGDCVSDSTYIYKDEIMFYGTKPPTRLEGVKVNKPKKAVNLTFLYIIKCILLFSSLTLSARDRL